MRCCSDTDIDSNSFFKIVTPLVFVSTVFSGAVIFVTSSTFQL